MTWKSIFESNIKLLKNFGLEKPNGREGGTERTLGRPTRSNNLVEMILLILSDSLTHTSTPPSSPFLHACFTSIPSLTHYTSKYMPCFVSLAKHRSDAAYEKALLLPVRIAVCYDLVQSGRVG